jgi:hypothetical protein
VSRLLGASGLEEREDLRAERLFERSIGAARILGLGTLLTEALGALSVAMTL